MSQTVSTNTFVVLLSSSFKNIYYTYVIAVLWGQAGVKFSRFPFPSFLIRRPPFFQPFCILSLFVRVEDKKGAAAWEKLIYFSERQERGGGGGNWIMKLKVASPPPHFLGA